MLILGLLGMYFDDAVVFVMKSSLFFRLSVAILWQYMYYDSKLLVTVVSFPEQMKF